MYERESITKYQFFPYIMEYCNRLIVIGIGGSCIERGAMVSYGDKEAIVLAEREIWTPFERE